MSGADNFPSIIYTKLALAFMHLLGTKISTGRSYGVQIWLGSSKQAKRQKLHS